MTESKVQDGGLARPRPCLVTGETAAEGITRVADQVATATKAVIRRIAVTQTALTLASIAIPGGKTAVTVSAVFVAKRGLPEEATAETEWAACTTPSGKLE